MKPAGARLNLRHPQRGKVQIAIMLLSRGRSCLQVDETVGFADDEDPSDGLVSDRRDEGLYLDELEGAVSAEGLPKVSSAGICPQCETCQYFPLHSMTTYTGVLCVETGCRDCGRGLG